MDISAIVRDLRASTDKTQAEFGKLIGIPAHTVGNWERGKSEPSLEALFQIANAMHLTLDELLQFEPGFDPNETDVPKYRYLSEEECDLVDGYRAMNKTEREFYLNNARLKLAQKDGEQQ